MPRLFDRLTEPICLSKVTFVWDLVTGKDVLTLRGHTDWVRGVAFSPDGHWLATGSGDGTAKVWDARTGEEVLTLDSHKADVLRVAFSPAGRILATLSLDGTTKVWDVRRLVHDH